MTPNAVKRIRKKLGISQADLARKIGVARQTVNRWENADRSQMHPIFEAKIRQLEKETK